MSDLVERSEDVPSSLVSGERGRNLLEFMLLYNFTQIFPKVVGPIGVAQEVELGLQEAVEYLRVIYTGMNFIVHSKQKYLYTTSTQPQVFEKGHQLLPLPVSKQIN